MKKIEIIESALHEELPYRKVLPGNDFNFGIEIEMEQIDIKNTDRLLNHKIDETWDRQTDQSLNLDSSLELASPVLKNAKETWIELRKLSKTLKHVSPTFEHASFQVNLDMINEANLMRLLKLFVVYEKIIYGFSKGEDEHFRKSMKQYATPISRSLYIFDSILAPRDKIKEFKNKKRYGIAINSINKGPTKGNEVIEFRTPNGTVDAWYWQNYVNTFNHMVEYVNSKKFDDERIERKFEKCYRFPNIYSYEQIDIDTAFQFANLIFKEDIDKLYFLKHYFKNNEEKVKTYIKECIK